LRDPQARPRRCFPWPVTDDELDLNDALDIAMRHFDLPSDEEEYAAVESFVVEAIMDDWRRGVRNKIAIKTILLIADDRSRMSRLRHYQPPGKKPDKNGVLKISRNKRERSRRGLIRSESWRPMILAVPIMIAQQASNYFALRLLGISTERRVKR
jgi:hypothetical protein